MPRELHFEGLRNGAPQRVFIAVPMTDKPEPETVMSLIASAEALRHADIEFEIFLLIGHCHVDDARNYLARNFLESQCTDLMFVDSDVGFDSVDLVRLLRYEADVVGGAYPKKTDDDQGYPVRFLPGPRITDKQGLLKVEGIATGFLRIKRWVIDQLWEDEPRKYRDTNEGSDRKEIAIIFERLFLRGKDVSMRLSGDYGFCKKCRDVSIDVYVDPAMTFAHVGTKMWSGNVGQYLCEKEGLLTPRFQATFRRIQAGQGTADDFKFLYIEWGNNFALPPDFAEALLSAACEVSGPILEIGSGLTTLLLAVSGNPVHSIEQDLAWLLRVKAAAKQLRLSNIELTYSPLMPEENDEAWYSEVPKIVPSLVFCDGPQQRWRRGRIFQAMEIPASASFIADDASNPTWLADIQKWAAGQGRTVEVVGTDTRKLAIVAPRLARLEAAE